ncbi:MAG: AlkZ family DNA glycosylase [Deltaproteobacteria bacterium]|nr:AlkZ family DNA glycosylase [Deltaproteobacteria bacterium]
MSAPLSTRALGRALLARQMLLARADVDVVTAVRRLAGMQAQVAPPLFVGLWSRLLRVTPDDLVARVMDRSLVRGTLMRGTLHLVTADDLVAFRPTLGPTLLRSLAGTLGARLGDLDLDAVVAHARALYATGPRAFDRLRVELAQRFPDADERAPGYAVRMALPLVQVPEGAPWGWSAKAEFTPADDWLGREVPASTDDPAAARALVLRYLAAFGPASVKDAQAWSGMGGLAPAFEALRPELVVFRDARKRELFDLPDAPRPPEDTPAPVRLVAAFDNLILSHDDRTRIVPEAARPRLATKNLLIPATVLVDGLVDGTWTWKATKKAAELTVVPFSRWTKATAREVEAEGHALLAMVAPGLAPRVTTQAAT